MKNYFLIGIGLLVILASCEYFEVVDEEIENVTVEQSSQSSQGGEEYDTCFTFVLDGDTVVEGAFDTYDTTLFTIIELDSNNLDANCDYTISVFAYTTEDGYVLHLQNNGLNIVPWLQFADSISNFADTTNLEDTVNLTGGIPDWYYDYSSEIGNRLGIGAVVNKKSTSLSQLRNYHFPGHSNTILHVYRCIPRFYSSMNKDVSSYYTLSLPYGCDVVYKTKWLEKSGKMPTLWRWGWSSVAFLNFLRPYDDVNQSWLKPM